MQAYGYLTKQYNQIQKLQSRTTNVKMNFLKAFAIFAIVGVHCCNGSITYFMGSWLHPSFYYITVFIFIAGYFYKKENDAENFWHFLKQKFLTLVLPYFGWNLFYGLLSAVVRRIGLVEYGEKLSLYSFFVQPWVDGHQYHFNIPSWFLLSLFLVSVITCVLRAVLRKLHLLNDYLLLAALLAVSVLSVSYAQRGYNTGWLLCLVRTGFLLPFFQLGFIYKRFEAVLDKNRLIVIPILTVILYGIFIINQGTLDINCVFARFIGKPLPSVAAQFVVLLLLSTVCSIMVPAVENSKFIRYIGDHSFTVMMHHPFWIFALNTAIYVLSRLFHITSFDVQQYKTTIWYCYPWRDSKIYLFYVAFALLMPLLLKWIWDKIIVSVYQKKNLQN